LSIAVQLSKECGVTRVSDIAGLDRLHIPCYQSVRATALAEQGNISVYSGASFNAPTAKMKSLMEAIERYWAENSLVRTYVSSISDLKRQKSPFIDPVSIPLPVNVTIDEKDVLEWVEAFDFQGNSFFLTAHDAFCPYVPSEKGTHNPRIWRSAGIATGADYLEAAFYATLEVIERDAVALSKISTQVVTSVDLAEIDIENIRLLLDWISNHDIKCSIKKLSALGHVEVFVAILEDRRNPDPLLFVGGYGADLDPVVAIEQSIMEALQSRAVVISGAREDLDVHSRISLDEQALIKRSEWVNYQSVASYQLPEMDSKPINTNLKDVFAALISTLASQGYFAYFVELTPKGYPLSVVRAVIPGASHITETQIRLGSRVVI